MYKLLRKSFIIPLKAFIRVMKKRKNIESFYIEDKKENKNLKISDLPTSNVFTPFPDGTSSVIHGGYTITTNSSDTVWLNIGDLNE